MRIHLGHHFYGAGNLGDDFMLAGFLEAMRAIVPEARFSGSVPFPLSTLKARFPEVEWYPYTDEVRSRCIRETDAWLGLGGSPFQSAQSRWFIDHLVGDAALCDGYDKPMFYLGVGVQSADELAIPEIRALLGQARAIWTRDPTSAARIRACASTAPVSAAADPANIWFRSHKPPEPTAGRLTLVANFDYAEWPGLSGFLEAADQLRTREKIWLAQEARMLPGSERSLYLGLEPLQREKWQLWVADEEPQAANPTPRALSNVLDRWPTGEWLVTSRYHAALAGAWGGSKIVVIPTNEKLRAIAEELNGPMIAPNASASQVIEALTTARTAVLPSDSATKAFEACEALVRTISSS